MTRLCIVQLPKSWQSFSANGDILMKLAREALEAADLPDLQSLFADEVAVSNSPLGCPTAPSAPLPVPETATVVSWAEWIAQRGVTRPGSNGERTKAVKASQNQISMF